MYVSPPLRRSSQLSPSDSAGIGRDPVTDTGAEESEDITRGGERRREGGRAEGDTYTERGRERESSRPHGHNNSPSVRCSLHSSAEIKVAFNPTPRVSRTLRGSVVPDQGC